MRRCAYLLLAFAAPTLAASPSLLDPSAGNPPVASKRPHTFTIHGETLSDPYHWLRQRGSADVMGYLEAENAYTAAVTSKLEPVKDAIYREMLGRIQQTDLTVPYPKGGWWYYSRTQEGKQYPVLCRKKGNLDAAEEVMLDVNKVAEGHKFLGLGAQQVSDDGTKLAYATDTTGYRVYDLFVKDLTTGELLPDRLEKVHSPQWSADGRYMFYVVDDAAKRSYRAYRHELGTPREKDVLLYEEKDETFRIGLGRTLDRKYLILSSGSFESSEVRYLPTDGPTGEWTLFRAREPHHRYGIAGHRDGAFYVLTNKDAKDFRLVKTPEGDPSTWTDVIPHRQGILLRSVTVLADYLVADEKSGGLERLAVHDLKSGDRHEIAMDEPAYSLGGSMNAEFDTTKFRFGYSSFVTPQSVYEYDLASRKRRLLKQDKVLGEFDAAQFRTERVWVPAKDGVKIPLSLVYRKDVKRDGSAPCLLYGYGAYGNGMSASFASSRLSLLDRGVVFALAHIRGGNELGERWHDDGKMLHKRNTFTDFIACGDWLCDQKYTAHERLAVQGGSAGGLLVGATLNIAPPDFCRAAVLQVPFVDVINTMLDESIPLTVPEFLEWGNPKAKDQYDYMRTYCPYSNLSARPYPSILVTTSLNDSQVMYWEPAKYVARLRTLKTDANPLVFKCNMAGGHGGSSGRYDALKELAFVYAFVLDQVGARN